MVVMGEVSFPESQARAFTVVPAGGVVGACPQLSFVGNQEKV